MTVAKKSLGQHWLHDSNTLESISEAAQIGEKDVVLEIGPGLGTLTEVLLKKAAKVYAVEFDESLISDLKRKFQNYKDKFVIEHADILKFDFANLPPGYKVVANIPYYLTSNLLRVLCETPNHFSTAALLVQKEVAQRVCANPGEMSILSVSVQMYSDAKLGMVVKADLFTPPPKVDSQVLILDHLEKPRFEVDTNHFFRIVKAGFSERRKMLRSSLSGGLGIEKYQADEMLVRAGIDPNLRAQALSLEEWFNLYKLLAK